MPDNSETVFICASSDLIERGKGIRFPLTAWGDDATGFAVRYEGVPRAYLNRCAHLSVELDLSQGTFFDSSAEHLVCGHHGAMYVPDTGRCATGACAGQKLHAIAVTEKDNQVYWHPNDYFRPVMA